MGNMKSAYPIITEFRVALSSVFTVISEPLILTMTHKTVDNILTPTAIITLVHRTVIHSLLTPLTSPRRTTNTRVHHVVFLFTASLVKTRVTVAWVHLLRTPVSLPLSLAFAPEVTDCVDACAVVVTRVSQTFVHIEVARFSLPTWGIQNYSITYRPIQLKTNREEIWLKIYMGLTLTRRTEADKPVDVIHACLIIQTWITLTFIEVVLTLFSHPSWLTGTRVAPWTVSTPSSIVTRHTFTLVHIDVTVSSGPPLRTCAVVSIYPVYAVAVLSMAWWAGAFISVHLTINTYLI